VATYLNYRRFCLCRRRAALVDDPESDAAWAWQGFQERSPSTALPANFPELTALAALGYTAQADLEGADLEELTKQGISAKHAARILVAYAEL